MMSATHSRWMWLRTRSHARFRYTGRRRSPPRPGIAQKKERPLGGWLSTPAWRAGRSAAVQFIAPDAVATDLPPPSAEHARLTSQAAAPRGWKHSARAAPFLDSFGNCLETSSSPGASQSMKNGSPSVVSTRGPAQITSVWQRCSGHSVV
jgi:hypothetical protein